MSEEDKGFSPDPSQQQAAAQQQPKGALSGPNPTPSDPSGTSDATAGNDMTSGGGAAPASVAPAASAPAPTNGAAGGAAVGPAAPAAASPTQSTALALRQPQAMTTVPAKPQPLGDKILHGILGALGGTQEKRYSVDPATGKLVVTEARMGTGQQWKHIIAGALTGAAAGFAQRGPGAMGRSAAAGFGAGYTQRQAGEDRAFNRSKEVAEETQKGMVASAQVAYLNQQIARGAWEMVREGNADKIRQTEADQATLALVQSDPEATDLGVYDSFNAFLQKHGQNADNLAKAQVNKEIRLLPHYNDKGMMDGVHVFKVSKAWDQQKIEKDTPVNFGPKVKADGTWEPDIQVVPAGSMTNGEVTTHNQAAGAREYEMVRQDKEYKTREATAKSEQAKNYAEASKARAETESLSSTNEDADNIAQQLFEGRMSPSELSKRASKGSNTWNHIVSLADKKSMAATGQHYDPARAEIDYSFAKNPNTQNVLRYLNSLTGSDNKSGNLDELVKQSAQYKRISSFPAINDVQAWAKLESGDPGIAALHTTATEVADQFAKIMQGGGSGNATSDAKIKQGIELFRTGFTQQQMEKVAGTLRPLLGNRKTELIKGNRFLEAQFGEKPAAQANGGAAAAPAAQAKQAAAGAQPGEQPVFVNGAVVGYSADGGKTMRPVTKTNTITQAEGR